MYDTGRPCGVQIKGKRQPKNLSFLAAQEPHLLVSRIKLIEARAETALQMRKHSGLELLPRVRVSARRRDAKDVTERVKNFIERILERQFMTSQNHQTEPPEREQALPREIFGPLPTRSDHDGTLQTGTDLRQERLFFFCSINSSLHELYG